MKNNPYTDLYVDQKELDDPTDPVTNNTGPWQIHDQEISYDTPWLRVTKYFVTQVDGQKSDYGVVQFKNIAVGILPIDKEGYTWLVGQHRFALGQYSWELPQGGCPRAKFDKNGQLLSPSEQPIEAARRELEEETGMIAHEFIAMPKIYTSNCATNEVAYSYIGWGGVDENDQLLDFGIGQKQYDGSEDLKQKRLPFNELVDQVLSGEINDGFTCNMVLHAKQKATQGLLPIKLAALLL